MLERDFYMRDALCVAPQLLGKLLVHETPQGRVSGKIVEVEAYMGAEDAAAHSYQNRKSVRTRIQYGEGGFAYIYMIYGMHYCFNVVTGDPGTPHAILVRALEPVEGIDVMQKNRGTDALKTLTNGPGKLCQALGITAAHYGLDLCHSTLYLEEFETVPGKEIVAAKRINVDYAGEAKDYLWRYYIKGNTYVSRK